jgi:hypothetical protein
VLSPPCQGHGYLAGRRRELDRIVEEVSQDLGQARGVAADPHRLRGKHEVDIATLEERLVVFTRAAHELDEVEASALQSDRR